MEGIDNGQVESAAPTLAKSTPVTPHVNNQISKRKIDDINSPENAKFDSIIFTPSTQGSPNRKFRLLEGETSGEPNINNPTNTDQIKVGIKGRGNKLIGGAKITYQQTIPKRGTRRVQPTRAKKVFKAKRINIQDKQSKPTDANKRNTSSPLSFPSKSKSSPLKQKGKQKDTNPITRHDLEECLELSFAKLKLEFPSREEVNSTLELHKCKLLQEVSAVHEFVQSNAISINTHRTESEKTQEGLTNLKQVVDQSEEERKSDYQFLANKVNKLTANVTNVRKLAERSNTAMLSTKLSETTESLKAEIQSLQSKYSESEKSLDLLSKEVSDMKKKFEKIKTINQPTQPPPSGAQVPDKVGSTTNLPTTDFAKCIIIEGVTESPNENLFNIMSDLISLHSWEINFIERVGRFTQNRNWPRPIRVSLIADWKRDLLLENNDRLFYTEHYFRVNFKLDEPKHVRVAKAKLRQALNRAKRQGAITRQSEHGIHVNGIKYTIHNVDEIPDRFTDTRRAHWPSNKLINYRAPITPRPNITPTVRRPLDPRNEAENDNMEIDMNQDVQPLNGEWLEPGLRKTAKGLAFFIYRIYMSNLNESPFFLNNENHKTGEHGLQMEKAWFHRDYEAVTKIRKASTPAEAKDIGRGITSSPEWNVYKYMAADKVSYARYTQNPELAERLCATGDSNLLEASTDTDWGIGISIWDNAVVSGEGPGNNNFGKSTERVRSKLQKDKRERTGIWAVQ